jgi:hypothetical protein
VPLLPVIAQNDLNLMIYPVDWTDLPSTYLNRGELEIIVALVRSAKHHDLVVEIGLAEGRTAKAILRELPEVRSYLGIDTDASYRTKLPGQWTERSASPGYLAADDPRFYRWLFPRGSLDLTSNNFKFLLPVDAVFIDGDHSSEVVRHDSDLARAIVRSGGVIIWHDYQNGGVEVAPVLELDRLNGHDICHIEGTWLAFERR